MGGNPFQLQYPFRKYHQFATKGIVSVGMLSEDMENSRTCEFCLNSQYMCPDGCRSGTHQIWVQKVDGLWQFEHSKRFWYWFVVKEYNYFSDWELDPMLWYSETWAMLQWLFTRQCYTYMCEDNVNLFEHRPNGPVSCTEWAQDCWVEYKLTQPVSYFDYGAAQSCHHKQHWWVLCLLSNSV